MGNITYFLNMFSDYQPPEELFSCLSQAAVVAADIDPEGRSVEVAIHSGNYIPQRVLTAASGDICRLYGLKRLDITATHPANQIQRMEPEELCQLFVDHNSMNRGALAGAGFSWTDNTLEVRLLANGKREVEEAIPAVRQTLRQRFAVDVDIQVYAGQNLEGEALFEAMKKIRADAMGSIPLQAAAIPKRKSLSRVRLCSASPSAVRLRP